MKNKQNQRVFSGTQPSGESHIGNYLGAFKNFVNLQDKYECFFFIADYHSITENYDPKEKPKQIMNLALDYLAAGLDPQKCIIFQQSDVPEHTELAWIFNTVTPMGLLERMTQYKDKAQRQNANINVGLFDYPVLQAADILIYKAGLVPIGQDQIQHLELSRNIAHAFNKKFGATFPEPQALLTETPKIMSLLDPAKKMSKSLGPKSYIGINDSPEKIKEKMKKAVTAESMKELVEKYKITSIKGLDEIGEILIKYANQEVETPESKKAVYGVANLIMLLSNFATSEHSKYFIEKIKNADKEDIKFSELKEVLAQDIADYFAPFRARRKELETKPEYVKEILADGAARARKIARETMREVKEKIGLVI